MARVTFAVNVTRVQQLKAAFDQCIGMALGGWGGMTQ